MEMFPEADPNAGRICGPGSPHVAQLGPVLHRHFVLPLNGAKHTLGLHSEPIASRQAHLNCCGTGAIWVPQIRVTTGRLRFPQGG